MNKVFIRYKLDFPYVCKICGKTIKSKPGIATHTRGSHKEIGYKKYLKEYENIDIDLLTEEWLSKADERKEKLRANMRKYNETIGYKSPKDRMTEEQYISWRNSMSKVFSLDWFIEKYGEDIGNKKYNERSALISSQTREKFNTK